jgi:DNA-directed RNA polymerase specialized sigma subunit
VVVLAADRPDEDIPRLRIDFHYRTGHPELDAEATEVRSLRTQADALAAVVGERTSAVATALVEQGFPVRDIAAMLGISPQRVSQITRAQAG